RRGLIVGVDQYDSFRGLTGCVADAEKMTEVMGRNYDRSPNYGCKLLTSCNGTRVTRAALSTETQNLFRNFSGDVFFYFSGHGWLGDTGGLLVTQDGTPALPGLSMSELLQLANNSNANSVLIALDCCFAGNVGDISWIREYALPQVQLRQ